MFDIAVTIATIVIHTPFWVWLLYAALLFLGFQRTRDSVVPLYRALILPFTVVFMTLTSFIAAGYSGAPWLLVGLVFGMAAGWRLEPEGATRRTLDNKLWLRGEWWSFAQLVLVLVFRYSTSVTIVMSPNLNTHAAWQVSTLLIPAVLSGMFLGRTAARLGVYWQQEPRTA